MTPPERLTDGHGRPYFLWDCDLTLEQFRRALEDPDPEVRAYLVGKLMRQAKPDDVFQFVRPRTIRELWPRLTRYLGHTREFWTWLFEAWGFRVGDGREVCIVDLVAEPLGPVEPPQRADVLGASVAVDTPHEILVNKLTALLGRSELRDLVDVKALLDAGGDLDRALADTPRKDGGFSPLTLAWVLKGFDPRSAARALGWSAVATDEIVSFQHWLVERLTAASAPE